MNYYLAFTVSKVKIGNSWTLFNWLNTQNISIEDLNHPLYQMLESGKKKIEPFKVNGLYDDFEYLRDNHFFVENQEVIRNIVRSQYLEIIDGRNISVTMMPVNQACNCRCRYCYEDHDKVGFMGDADLAIFQRFIGRQDISYLRIDYFGGEPLLNIGFIKKCNSSMIALGERAGFSLTPSSITTNGYYLTRDNFLSLYDLRITSFQVTVDGDRENHDKYRPLSNGQGTYDVIYKNLLDIASTERNFSLTLRTNFTPKNGSKEKRIEFLEKIKSDFKGDKRFVLMPEPIGRWKDDEEYKDEMHSSFSVANVLREQFQMDAEDMGLETLSMVLLCGPESHFCYASKPNDMVIYPLDEHGRLPIQKCTLEVNRKNNNVGFIDSDGQLIKNENWQKWVVDNLFVNKKCRNCFFVMNCFGNSCAYKNQSRGQTICPREKSQEYALISRILKYISNHQQ